jgi:hypothetical protein
VKNEEYARILGVCVIVVIVVSPIVVACAPRPSAGPSALRTAEGTPAPTDVWSALLQRTPYPYTTPLPPPIRTILDGTYAKSDPREATRIPCRRCPDYFPYNGIWKLSLDNGIFRIFHPDTGWRSYLSFTVSGDRIALFNDPNCPEVVGVYAWKLARGTLTLKVIEDECAIHLRAMNLTSLPWLSCQSPTTEAAVTDHRSKPPGCQ